VGRTCGDEKNDAVTAFGDAAFAYINLGIAGERLKVACRATSRRCCGPTMKRGQRVLETGITRPVENAVTTPAAARLTDSGAVRGQAARDVESSV